VDKMIIATTDSVNGKFPKKTLGLVRGSTVRARWFGRDIAAAFKNLVGGEIRSYTELVDAAREEALKRMEERAKAMGANAIVGVQFASSEVMQGASEIICYGTAVEL
jgi:uncharacterized protein YbjQ (UPF0145 family)